MQAALKRLRQALMISLDSNALKSLGNTTHFDRHNINRQSIFYALTVFWGFFDHFLKVFRSAIY